MFRIVDRERRWFAEEFDTREAAEARLAHLRAQDPEAEDLVITSDVEDGPAAADDVDAR
jgi:hypothetical protein